MGRGRGLKSQEGIGGKEREGEAIRVKGIWGGVGGGLDQWERGKRVQGNAAGS